MASIGEAIQQEILAWDGVTMEPHRFGGVEFMVNNHEIGHLHGTRLADLPFPVRVREELVASGKASPHHILPDTGWVSYFIRSADDVSPVVNLFRLNYERLAGPGHAVPADDAPPADPFPQYDEVVEESFPASDPPSGPAAI